MLLLKWKGLHNVPGSSLWSETLEEEKEWTKVISLLTPAWETGSNRAPRCFYSILRREETSSPTVDEPFTCIHYLESNAVAEDHWFCLLGLYGQSQGHSTPNPWGNLLTMILSHWDLGLIRSMTIPTRVIGCTPVSCLCPQMSLLVLAW